MSENIIIFNSPHYYTTIPSGMVGKVGCRYDVKPSSYGNLIIVIGDHDPFQPFVSQSERTSNMLYKTTSTYKREPTSIDPPGDIYYPDQKYIRLQSIEEFDKLTLKELLKIPQQIFTEKMTLKKDVNRVYANKEQEEYKISHPNSKCLCKWCTPITRPSFDKTAGSRLHQEEG